MPNVYFYLFAKLFRPYVYSGVWSRTMRCIYTCSKGPFKYYVIKEVGGRGQKIAIFDDLQYCKSSKKWVGGPKKVKYVMS